MDRVADSLAKDRKPAKSINMTYWLTIILTIITITCAILKTLDFMIVVAHSGPTFVFYIMMSQVLQRTTIAFQYITFFVAITVVVKYTKRLNALITRVQERVQFNDVDSNVKNIIKKEKIQEWAQMYLDLANSCEKVSLCFGRQVLANRNGIAFKTNV
ncbi:hypothetical protein HF086_017925 [Spodoptera exigua]|uniref:Uncharacterized protein n=1 Tax=Spodoptera exigua TaxID=7107 RepID=A0A922SFP0_SPOEX|nr:hypothetical protein HF086_017925 [Spodoptera exigua]